MIIKPVIPGVVIKTCPVHYSRAMNIGTVITRGISHINHGGRSLINIDVLGVIPGIFGGYLLDLLRTIVSDSPGTIRRIRLKPNSIVTQVIILFVPEYSAFGIYSIFQFKAFYPFKFGIAIIHYFIGLGISFNSCRLRDLRVVNSVPGFFGTGYDHVQLGGLQRDARRKSLFRP